MEPLSWTEPIPVDDYMTDDIRNNVCREDGSLHRLYQALAPWPSAIVPADAFYRTILHAPDCPLDLHNAEFVAAHVAALNECAYALAHHGENFCATGSSRLEAELALRALQEDDLTSDALSGRQRAIATYTRKLTREPQAMERGDIVALTDAGLTDAEIVHVNQIAASFGYWTRMINGLGITLGDEGVGLAPGTLAGITNAQPQG